MRSRRLRGAVIGITLGAMALVGSGCSFGGGQSAPQPTATSIAESSPSPSPVASPPRLPSPQASPPSTTASPGPQSSGGGGEQTYTVEAGDTLATIAQKFYGDAGQW